jgi:hypothetical protein
VNQDEGFGSGEGLGGGDGRGILCAGCEHTPESGFDRIEHLGEGRLDALQKFRHVDGTECTQ